MRRRRDVRNQKKEKTHIFDAGQRTSSFHKLQKITMEVGRLKTSS